MDGPKLKRKMESIAYKIIFVLLLFITTSLFALIVADITGNTGRGYEVLDPAATIMIGNAPYTLKEFAKKYQPIVRLHFENPSPPLIKTYYEIVDNDKSWDLIYYNVWEDEVNPNPLFHQLYRIFRAAYYGYPVRDIEYVQLSIDKLNGNILRLQFETSPGEDYFVIFSVHWIARYTRVSDGQYLCELIEKKTGKLMRATQVVSPWFEDEHPVIEIATWNHLTRLASPEIHNISSASSPSLFYLSSDDYRSMKFVRKSQGDHKTSESVVDKIIGIGSIIIFSFVTGFWILLLFSRINKRIGNGKTENRN
jgi:hypothetical protein